MDFHINKLTHPSVDTIDTCIEIIREVWQNMPERSWFSMDSREEITERFPKEQAWLYLASAAEKAAFPEEPSADFSRENSDKYRLEKLAGIVMVTFPGLTEENLGRDLDFAEDMLLQTAHMDTAVILPAYRGNGLQGRLMQKAEEDLKQAGFRCLLCTIHPDNHYSMNNALKLGYRVAKSTVKYNGLPRNILYKAL